jgi:UDP-glucuronate decarboxylase
MHILVIVEAGFLGSRFSERLKALRHYMFRVVNIYTGTLKNIEHLRKNHEFEFLRLEITFLPYVALYGNLNLSCLASPVHYQHNPVQTFKTIVQNSMNMLSSIKQSR